jgi:cytochrome c peroxidase
MLRNLTRTSRQFKRFFASEGAPPKPSPPKSSGLGGALVGVGGIVAAGAGYYLYNQSSKASSSTADHTEKPIDYKNVAKDISGLLEKDVEYDGIGHYGPILVRLAWHSSGTYDAKSKTGGSDGGTMRHGPEASFGANAGLAIARSLLEPIKAKYGDQLSYGDLWTLAGVVAIREMGGPEIPWRPGRVDKDEKACPPDGRLPDASKDQKHVRDIFYRMGFNDQEIVALSGAHALGKCHTDRSGYKGPWTFSPISFTNAYFQLLLSEKWIPKETDVVFVSGKEEKKPWKGPRQYVDAKTETLMMLPSDLALIQDSGFKKYVELYSKNQDKWFDDFSKAFAKLLELGCSGNVLSNTPVVF